MGKRTLEDSPIDLAKMATAARCLQDLQLELRGIEETEEALRGISEDVFSLTKILQGVKKLKVDFSDITGEDLTKLGVEKKRLVLVEANLEKLTKGQTADTKAKIKDLQSKLNSIYECVNMDYGSRSRRMILGAILQTLRKITSTPERDITVTSNVRIGSDDGVHVSHPDSGHELWLSGNIDYVVTVTDHKKVDLEENRAKLIDPAGQARPLSEVARGLFLIEIKGRDPLSTLFARIPEAVSQAIALLESENLPEVRFCLSNGKSWIFYLLKKSENNTLAYYTSAIRHLNLDEPLRLGDLHLPEIMQLLCEWLMPTVTDLFVLMLEDSYTFL